MSSSWSFLGTSSIELDVSIDDFDLDYDPEELVEDEKKKKKKKKRIKKKKVRKSKIHPSEPVLPLEPEKIERPSLEIEEPYFRDITDLIPPEEDEFLLLQTKDQGPEPTGIVALLMRRRRAREIEEKLANMVVVRKELSVTSEEPSESTIPPPVVRKPKKPGVIACKFEKPGPGHYEYYSSVGYVGHDPTRKRAPGFSFGRKIVKKEKPIGPGPVYNMRGFTMRGKEIIQSHEFGKRRPPKPIEVTPGPGHYEDQTLFLSRTPLAATLHGRKEEKKTWQPPWVIGELTFMGNSRPAACLIGKPKALKPNTFPSPLTYPTVKTDAFKTKGPAFTMRQKFLPSRTDADFFPCVGTYNPNYDYFKKKCDIVIPKSITECLTIPLDMPERRKAKPRPDYQSFH